MTDGMKGIPRSPGMGGSGMDESQQSQTALPEDRFLPLRMLNEFVYCPRLYFLEHVQGLFAHNADTIDGAGQHRRGERRGFVRTSTPPPESPWGVPAREMTLVDPVSGLSPVGRLWLSI